VEKISLSLQPRLTFGKKNSRLRKSGYIPVHLYGLSLDPEALQCEEKLLFKVLAKARGNTPISISWDSISQEIWALIREVQWDPHHGNLLHVDFLRIDITQKITATVPIVLVGDSPGAKLAGGVVVQAARSVEISALPLNLPSEFKVDLSAMDGPQSMLQVSDLALPNNVDVASDPSELIARIEVIRVETIEERGETALEEGMAPGSPQASNEGTT
jgi:large subunit ribosomal protein L25